MKKMIPVYVLQLLLIVTCFWFGMRLSQQLDSIQQKVDEVDNVKTNSSGFESFNPQAIRVKIVGER